MYELHHPYRKRKSKKIFIYQQQHVARGGHLEEHTPAYMPLVLVSDCGQAVVRDG